MRKTCKVCNIQFNTRSKKQIVCSECRKNLICEVEGCNNKVSILSKMLCNKHCTQLRRKKEREKIDIINKCKKCNKFFKLEKKHRCDYCNDCRNAICIVDGCNDKVGNVSIKSQLCNKHYRLKNREKYKKKYYIACKNCGKRIITNSPVRRYCNKQCKSEWEIKHAIEKNRIKNFFIPKRVCEICGKEFIPKTFCKDTQHCCSEECRTKYSKKWFKKRYINIVKPQNHLGRGQSYPQYFVFTIVKEKFDKFIWDYDIRKVIKNPETNRYLELDIWCPTIRFAIEFDGIQHFEPKYGEKMFKYTQKMDQLKEKLCKENDITLLRISYKDNWKDKDWVIKKVGEYINGNY